MRRTKSVSFLVEFLIVILFFAIIAAVCVRIYGKAYSMNDIAQSKEQALNYAENYVETNSEKSNEPTAYYLNDDFKKTSDAHSYLVTVGQDKIYKYIKIEKGETLLVKLRFYTSKAGDQNE